LEAKRAPSFRAVLWTDPSSADRFRPCEIVLPTSRNSDGASNLISVKSTFRFAKDTAFSFWIAVIAAVTRLIALFMASVGGRLDAATSG